MELLDEVAPGRNRLVYILGHLTAMHDRMIALLGMGERIKPEYDSLFLTSPDKTNPLPNVEEVRQTWKSVSDHLNRGLLEVPYSEWILKHTAVTEEEFAKDPLRNKLSILLTRTTHLTYHLGQVNLFKR